MATLHLPAKGRNSGKKETAEEKTERKLDEGLKESLPTSDPVAITAPGGNATLNDATEKNKTVSRS